MSVFLLFWQPVIVLCYFAIFVLLVLIARWQINTMMMMMMMMKCDYLLKYVWRDTETGDAAGR